MSTATRLHFQRRLGIYLRTNHGYSRSGKLTAPQRRRLYKKNPDEMRLRRELVKPEHRKAGWA